MRKVIDSDSCNTRLDNTYCGTVIFRKIFLLIMILISIFIFNFIPNYELTHDMQSEEVLRVRMLVDIRPICPVCGKLYCCSQGKVAANTHRLLCQAPSDPWFEIAALAAPVVYHTHAHARAPASIASLPGQTTALCVCSGIAGCQ